MNDTAASNTMLSIDGVRLGTVAAGVRKPGRPDVVLFELAAGSACAAVFTRNAFCAAPVILGRSHLSVRMPRYLLINSGNANAGTGAAGMAAAQACCEAVAVHGGCAQEEVLPFSTGVIGEPLPVDRIRNALGGAFQALRADGWEEAARGIMTTDTMPKAVSRRVRLGDVEVVLNGIAKGAGMIHPNMATMLCFMATDARIAAPLLQRCLADAVDESFHCITVDGDTSTNDACVLVASGARDMQPLVSPEDPRYEALRVAVEEVCRELATAIVLDAEGATKFITIRVEEGRDREECLAAARTIALSPLVKTAFFAGDPNWGRILAALGRAPLVALDVNRVCIDLDEVCIVRAGQRADDYTEERGREVMQRSRITVRVRLGRGAARAHVWTSDLSYDYVRINAEYRT
ncbi:MAG: bifunctional glutamate N-acetyltransferase/amino-acid acetyltransferase ArgJ [Gammaproteobacteria bacterium]|jgi:glutamate N-acetyltransferase/amino-acid N-acetyltransferase|nr:bifunctional glutamate N-acetyltransferase/amino-acid acetyltransferase ArgJ [Gammaproteobacteria bacterium]